MCSFIFVSSQMDYSDCYRVEGVNFHPQKEDKSQQHKSRNGVKESAPVQKTPSPKPSSPDAFKASMATVSNIDIQLQQDDNAMKRQVQEPQSGVSNPRLANEPVTHGVYKDSKGRGKPDPSPPPSSVKPPLKSVSDVGSGGEERMASNGLSEGRPRATPNRSDTFSVFGEKQVSPVDDKDDTIELLKEADAQNPNLENIEVVNVDDNNDTLTLFKQAPAQHLRTSDIQVSVHSCP